MTDRPVDVLVVGAGVVGLACARALAQAGHAVVIAEQAKAIGTGVSSRSSEVVHAGLHGAPGSLKATLCVQGRDLLYAYCTERRVDHRRCGKLLVAPTAADEPALQALAQQARQAQPSGPTELPWLSGAQARALEPALHCHAALWSPHSGIVDSHALMWSLLADAEAAGAVLARASPVVRAQPAGGGWQVQVREQGPGTAHGGGSTYTLATRWLVNCAGLDAQALARRLDGFPAAHIPPLHRARGHYFALPGRAPFSRLIYPTPVDGGLGIHLTLDLAGSARFGPDVEWLADTPPDVPGDALDYTVDRRRAPAFEADVRRWWPALPAGALVPAYAGVRPKLSGPGAPAADFRIDGPGAHGCAGVVQLFGIESPGLTACLAIAQRVAALVH